MMITGLLLVSLSLLLSVSAEDYTYQRVILSGGKLVCDKCEPGTRLQAHCTETRRSVCQSCSAGFYTEFWNYIRDCLPCDLCALNQEETQPCTTKHNRVCQCKEGYHWLSHFCKKHTVCSTGHGVRSQGTPTKDTKCEPCVDGHYAAGAAGSKQCTPHTPCQSDQRLVIKGTNWHDNICVTCDNITTRGWSGLIKPLLSELFSQQKSRRIHRVIRHLSFRANGSLPDIQEWLSGASEEALTELPGALTKANLQSLSDKVEHKIKKLQEEARNCSNNIM